MEYAVSRVVVQRLCDERADLVPYLPRVIDSLERHGGLYHGKLTELVPLDVVEELNRWLTSSAQPGFEAMPEEMNASLAMLERIFLEPANGNTDG
jgi:hypothetical protein